MHRYFSERWFVCQSIFVVRRYILLFFSHVLQDLRISELYSVNLLTALNTEEGNMNGSL